MVLNNLIAASASARSNNLLKRLSSSWEAYVFSVFVTIFAIITHQIYLKSGWMINPDESEVFATARLAMLDGGINSNYTTTTHSPVLPELIAILGRLGMTLDHFNAHRLALILKLIIFVIPQFIVVKRFGILKLGPILFALNATLFLPTSHEFAFFATEFFPLLFLTLSAIMILHAKSDKSFFVAGILFAIAFLSKYQSLLMIVILISFIFLGNIQFGVLNLSKFSSQLLKFTSAFFMTVLIFLLLLVDSGSLKKFIEESFSLSMNFSSSGGLGGSSNFVDRIDAGSSLLVGQPLVMVTVILIVFLIQIETLSTSKVVVLKYEMDHTKLAFLVFLVFFSVAFLTIAITGSRFPHYLLFFIWSLVLYLVALAKISELGSGSKINSVATRNFPTNKIMISVLVVAMAIGSFSVVAPPFHSVLNSSTVIRSNEARFNELGRAQVLKLCPRKSQVLVWGWSAELFAYFDWMPPPNVVNDAGRIKYSELNYSLMARLGAAVSNVETDCIYEALGQNYFGNFSLNEGVELLPEKFRVILKRDYSKSTLNDGTTVWTRRRTSD